MKDFSFFLEQSEEIGFVEQVLEPLIYATGLPHAHPGETVIFESGEIGSVFALHENNTEILLLSPSNVAVGTRVTRTGHSLKMKVGQNLLGRVISAADLENDIFVYDGGDEEANGDTVRYIDDSHLDFENRAKVTDPLETGVTIVDLMVPLAKGQRELVIGDRKTGKSNFLLQTLQTQKNNCICIYTAIAKSQLEIQRLHNFILDVGMQDRVVMIASHLSDRPGMIYYAPFVGMTLAEYFRDQGKDVILIMDDLTTHARYYREVTLLAKRFPGRSSYPGDIFYTHSRLLERAGRFKNGSITCLPVAQSVLSDFSGYIQTNLMSMTDGHIFFDSDFFDQGRRPAINPFLSVTRIGEQTQTALVRDLGRQLRSFFVSYEKIKQFKHFQTELSSAVQATFDLGNRLTSFLDQTADIIVPLHINIIVCAALYGDAWKNIPLDQMKNEMNFLIGLYGSDESFRKKVDASVETSSSFPKLVEDVKRNNDFIFRHLNEFRQKLEQELAEKAVAGI